MRIKSTVCGIEVTSEAFGDSSEFKEVTPIEFMKITGDDPYRLAAECYRKENEFLKRAAGVTPNNVAPREEGFWWYVGLDGVKEVVWSDGDRVCFTRQAGSTVKELKGTWEGPVAGPGLTKGMLQQWLQSEAELQELRNRLKEVAKTAVDAVPPEVDHE